MRKVPSNRASAPLGAPLSHGHEARFQGPVALQGWTLVERGSAIRSVLGTNQYRRALVTVSIDSSGAAVAAGIVNRHAAPRWRWRARCLANSTGRPPSKGAKEMSGDWGTFHVKRLLRLNAPKRCPLRKAVPHWKGASASSSFCADLPLTRAFVFSTSASRHLAPAQILQAADPPAAASGAHTDWCRGPSPAGDVPC